MTIKKINDRVLMLEVQLKAEKENYRKALTSYEEFADLKQIKRRIKSINSLLFSLQQEHESNLNQ